MDNPVGDQKPEWFSAIASGDIMKIKMSITKKQIDLRQQYKVAQFAFGETASGTNIFTPSERVDFCGVFFFLLFSFEVGFATFHDQSHIIEVLLQAGGDKEEKFEVGGVKYTPIEYAEAKGKKKALKTLQTYKIKPPRVPGGGAAAVTAEVPTATATATTASTTTATTTTRVAPVAAERTMLVFPGQGAQKVGMGKGLDSIPRAKVSVGVECGFF
jgi:hypothetical protein